MSDPVSLVFKNACRIASSDASDSIWSTKASARNSAPQIALFVSNTVTLDGSSNIPFARFALLKVPLKDSLTVKQMTCS